MNPESFDLDLGGQACPPKIEKATSAREELLTRNVALEDDVVLQAMVLEKMRDQITTFSNLNAHEVRGPVSRILGLLNLYLLDRDMKIDFLIARIKESALELDAVSRKISKMLEEVE